LGVCQFSRRALHDQYVSDPSFHCCCCATTACLLVARVQSLVDPSCFSYSCLLLSCAAAWTHFVKATFRKHSGDKKKAPSASLARSIFVTWLNGVPYDTHDSPFLNEMKLTAAEYQTHSLAIANSHYDKDAASEAKLRVLVDFCDSYSQWQPDERSGAGSGSSSSSGRSDSKDNVDSDDEGGSLNSGPSDMELGEDDSAAPLAAAGASSSSLASLSAAAPFAASASTSAQPAEIKKQPAQRPAARAKARASSSSSARKKKKASDSDSSDSSSSSEDEDENQDEQAADDDDAEYLPDRIIAKKTVRWQDFYLIHWRDYTAAERTWEPVAYFDQYCTKQTHDYEQARRPVRIVARKARPGDSKSAQEFLFEVQWQGRSSETSMERESSVQEDFPDLVKDWQRREEERKSRKHPRSAAGHEGKAAKGQETDSGGERPAKRRKGAGASGSPGS
jgi:hypothetical protein